MYMYIYICIQERGLPRAAGVKVTAVVMTAGSENATYEPPTGPVSAEGFGGNIYVYIQIYTGHIHIYIIQHVYKCIYMYVYIYVYIYIYASRQQ